LAEFILFVTIDNPNARGRHFDYATRKFIARVPVCTIIGMIGSVRKKYYLRLDHKNKKPRHIAKNLWN
jgi:hypothetical protein